MIPHTFRFLPADPDQRNPISTGFLLILVIWSNIDPYVYQRIAVSTGLSRLVWSGRDPAIYQHRQCHHCGSKTGEGDSYHQHRIRSGYLRAIPTRQSFSAVKPTLCAPCAVFCVLCALCFVLCAVCCVLCAVWLCGVWCCSLLMCSFSCTIKSSYTRVGIPRYLERTSINYRCCATSNCCCAGATFE